MDSVEVILERHEQKMLMIEDEIKDLKNVQKEIRAMNETLIALATELKNTNEHTRKNEKKIEEISKQPNMRLQQIYSAAIAALFASLISLIFNFTFHL